MNIALILSGGDDFLRRHDRDLETWAKREKKRIAVRANDHRRGLGERVLSTSAHLFYKHYAEAHIATLIRVREWLDRPLLQGEIR
jgi:hypothetical protein